jgi:MYXO-CTERM domain-containing protein
MRKVLFGLAGGAVIVALCGDALASPPLANTCFDVGLACLNAGPDGDLAGTCLAATCVDLLDASYACGVCEPADAGAIDGGTHGSTTDAGSSSTSAPDSEAPGVDAAPFDGDVAATDAEPVEAGASTGSGDAGSDVSSGSEAGSTSSGDGPDAAPAVVPAPPMPGCTAAPSSPGGSTGFGLIAVCVAAVICTRRRRH